MGQRLDFLQLHSTTHTGYADFAGRDRWKCCQSCIEEVAEARRRHWFVVASLALTGCHSSWTHGKKELAMSYMSSKQFIHIMAVTVKERMEP